MISNDKKIPECAGIIMDGYRLVRDQFDFSAEIILWHHRFQAKGYPERLPPPLHGYSRGTQVMIPVYGHFLALADCFDALHRANDKFGARPLSKEQIRQKMLEMNPDQRPLINKLYEQQIFA